MKKFLLPTGILLSIFSFSQIGINNTVPKATLDVSAKNFDGSTAEGIIVPKLTGDQIKAADSQYGNNQIGALVYATAAVGTSTAKTINITEPGYFFFDGILWKKVISQSQSFFIPKVVSSGIGSSDINMSDSTGFNKWSFNPNVNDGNWNATTNVYTVTKAGFYQLSLQGFVEPSTDFNSFLWTLTYTINNSTALYIYSDFTQVLAGKQYNQGGVIILNLPVGTQIAFGGFPCFGCSSTTYVARNRSFTIVYLGN